MMSDVMKDLCECVVLEWKNFTGSLASLLCFLILLTQGTQKEAIVSHSKTQLSI